MRIEEVILRNLVKNEDYTRKVIPFLSNEYFHDSQEKVLFEEIAKHITKYNGLPTQETLLISLDALDTITEDQFDEISKMVSGLEGFPVLATHYISLCAWQFPQIKPFPVNHENIRY
jgi:hypothetical protein